MGSLWRLASKQIRLPVDSRVLTVLLVVLLSLLLGNVLGQPIFLSYVETGSMKPSLAPGDGYVTTPTAISGPIDQGDVVVFRAEELQGGGLVTHRVVDETDRGFITQGDANPSTDQATGEPPVKREQIVAVAWQVNGDVVSIPQLGTAVGAIQGSLEWVQQQLASLLGTRALLGGQGLAYLLFATTVIIYIGDVLLSGDRRRHRSRDRETGLNVHLVVGVMALALILAATATMVLPAGSQQVEVVSSTLDSDRPTVIQQGTNDTLSLYLTNGGFLPVYSIFEGGSDRISVDPGQTRVDARGSANATITVSAPPETGAYRYYFTEHRYLTVLHEAHLQSLHAVHPWLPIVVIDALIAIPFYVVGILLAGTGRVRRRTREGPGTLERLWSRL